MLMVNEKWYAHVCQYAMAIEKQAAACMKSIAQSEDEETCVVEKGTLRILAALSKEKTTRSTTFRTNFAYLPVI